MQRVILDTNSIEFNSPLSSNAEKLTIDAAARRQIQLVVPELVIAETMNLWRERALEQLRKTRNEAEKLGRFRLKIEVPASEEVLRMAARIEAEFRDVLRSCHAEIPGYPSVEHREIVERALSRSQPFDSQGKDGYRDVLLWHTVKELSHESDVILVSNDKRAFAGDDAHLSPSLEDEVASPHRVELVPSLRDLAERIGQQDLAALERVRKLIREPSFRVLVNEALDDAIGTSFDLDARQIAELGYGVPIETAWFSGPEELGQIEALSAYSRPDAEALVELDIIMGVRIVFVVESDQIARTFSDEPDVWPEHAGMSWDDLRGSNGIGLGTVRLAHVRAEASIAVDDGRLNRLVAVSISLASPDEIFQEPSAMTEGEADEE